MDNCTLVQFEGEHMIISQGGKERTLNSKGPITVGTTPPTIF